MSNGLITMSAIGNMGRFGNSVFQWSFLNIYARKYGLEVQTPPWCGHELFGLKHNPITVSLPPYRERWPNGAMGVQLPPDGDEAANHDFCGYAQFQMGWYRPFREWIQNTFRLAPEHLARVEPAAERLRGMGRTVVGLHIRRTDYGRKLYYRVCACWYLALLARLWPTLDAPVLFVATENPGLVNEFVNYLPVTVEDLGLPPSGRAPAFYRDLPEQEALRARSLDFLPDWYLLSQCDVLITPNSTFSFTAGMVSTRLKRFFRSHLPERGFVELDLWDTTPLEYCLAEDYRHIPGVCLDRNPPHW